MLSSIELDRCSAAISSGQAMFKFRLDLDKVVKDKVPGLSGVLKSKPYAWQVILLNQWDMHLLS